MGRTSLKDLKSRASSHRDWRDGFAGFFGQDAKSVARTRTADDVYGYEPTWGDRIWGRDQSEMELEGEKIKQAILGKSPSGAAHTAEGGVIDHNTTQATLDRDFKLTEARQLAIARGADKSAVDAMTDLGQITVAGTKAFKAGERADLESSPANQRAIEAVAEEKRRYDKEQARLYRLDLETQATRQDQLASDAKDRQQTLQLKQMSMDADKARYEQDRMYYEQDKQKAEIGTLVAALASLGGAFAI